MLRCALFLSLIVSTSAFAEPRYTIEAVESQKVEALITYRIESTRFLADRWVVYLPKPPELPGQPMVRSSTTPTSRVVAEKSPLARQVYLIDQRATTPSQRTRIETGLKIEATLMKRRLVITDSPSKVPPLKDVERKAYLATSPLVDFDTALFREWMDRGKLKRDPGEGELVFAMRVLEEIRDRFEYSFEVGQDQRASLACSRGKGDCGGMSFAFVGAMRASGIPARPLIGRVAKPRREGSKIGDLDYDHPHVRAEFFVADIGWVPVDPSAVDSNASRQAASFLGEDPGDMIVLHVDIDLMLPFRDRTERAPYMQISPYFQAYGTGPFDAKFGETEWTVRKLPPK